MFSVADKVRELTGVEKVRVGNDANVAALGEQWRGGGRGFDNIVMVTLGTGVGGGVILDGKRVNCQIAYRDGVISVGFPLILGDY